MEGHEDMIWIVELDDEVRDALVTLLSARIAQAPRLIVEDFINADAYRARTKLLRRAQDALSEATLHPDVTLSPATARAAWDKLEEIGHRHRDGYDPSL